jgi:aryl-alcohol dehydrogenase-like predicted oxidoreductase
VNVLLGDGLLVPPIGYGAMGLSSGYGAIGEDAALATLHHAVDAGATLIDTADVYGRGGNERLVARLLRERRDEVVLATKFGIIDPDPDGLRSRGDPAAVRPAVLRSLERLGTDRIDLYYYHRVDPRVPIEDTVGAMADLVAEGLVGHLGVSEVTGEELRRAVVAHPLAAVQSEWSIWSRDVELHVVPAAVQLGVGFVAYSPLGRGFLAAPVALGPDDARRTFPRFDDDNLAVNQRIAAEVAAIAELEQRTAAQVALAWLFERGHRLGVPVVPIPGTRRSHRIDENLAALDVELEPASIERLDALAQSVAGDRARDASWVSQGRERDS